MLKYFFTHFFFIIFFFIIFFFPHQDERMDGRVSHASFVYGRGVGAAFQLVDDVLDFEGEFCCCVVLTIIVVFCSWKHSLFILFF